MISSKRYAITIWVTKRRLRRRSKEWPIRASALSVFLALLLAACAAWAQPSPNEELERIRSRIQALEEAVKRDRSRQSDALTDVKRTQEEIFSANQQLQELSEQRRRVNGELRALQNKKLATESRVNNVQKRLKDIYYRQYTRAVTNPLALSAQGENPNAIGRRLRYLAYVSQSQNALTQRLRGDLAELKDLRAQTGEKAAELTRLADEEKDKRSRLVDEQQKQERAVAALEQRIGQQTEKIKAYRRDEAKLTQLIERLAKEAERRRKAAEAKRKREREKALAARKKARKQGLVAQGRDDLLEPEVRVSGAFAKWRGRLPFPVAGELAGRYGSPRPESGVSWKGIFIRADSGQAVKAVADGEVVFADWLRGFGNLLIIDHGEGYMSLYGNNAAMHKNVGSAVARGEAVASVGEGGASEQSGLYFELRFRSRPLNPLSWLRR